MQKNAVVLFTGDLRREARRKKVPVRVLSLLHEEAVRTVRDAGGADLHFAHVADGEPATLGSRLGTAIEGTIRRYLAEGYSSVVLLAGDVFGLTTGDLRTAFGLLDERDRAVMGRSADGGFYLLGVTQEPALDWSVLPWFTPDAADALASAFTAAAIPVAELRSIADVDDRQSAFAVARSLTNVALFAALARAVLSLLTLAPLTARPGVISLVAVSSAAYLRGPPASPSC